jgi:plasmid stability protein
MRYRSTREEQMTDTDTNAETKTTKSIVPSKYSGRYKNGGDDALAKFIKEQSIVDGNFQFDRFFELCARNGIADEKVEHYRAQVAEKRHGAEGRARMTLRNMLATIVRKNGKALGLDGSEVAIDLPKPALTGAAKAASEATSTGNQSNLSAVAAE